MKQDEAPDDIEKPGAVLPFLDVEYVDESEETDGDQHSPSHIISGEYN